MMKSESVEDYLKAIYLIQEQQNGLPVATSSLAARLGIANGSVTGMIKRIAAAEPPLIDYEPYSGVTLTQAGQKMALEVFRHHRLIECYLSQKLGYTWDEVHAEAERLEHVISEAMEDRLANALGNPHIDPHGDPIPDRDGHLDQPDYRPLADLSAGQAGEIRRITGQEPELLRYLAELGLVLFTQIEVLATAPFHGPISIRVKNPQPTNLAVGREVAEKILVLPRPTADSEHTDEAPDRS